VNYRGLPPTASGLEDKLRLPAVQLSLVLDVFTDNIFIGADGVEDGVGLLAILHASHCTAQGRSRDSGSSPSLSFRLGFLGGSTNQKDPTRGLSA